MNPRQTEKMRMRRGFDLATPPIRFDQSAIAGKHGDIGNEEIGKKVTCCWLMLRHRIEENRKI
jgi:hypothetical protein